MKPWLRLLLTYLATAPLPALIVYLFDIHLEYDGDIAFWLVAFYSWPALAIQEVVRMPIWLNVCFYYLVLGLGIMTYLRLRDRSPVADAID